MADLLSFNVGAAAKTAADTASTTVVYMLMFGAGAAVLLFILWYFSYKHKVILKRVTANGIVISYDKAKEVKVDGYTMWRFMGLRRLVSVPPSEAIKTNKKGKLVAECYYSDDLGVIWSTDLITEKTFKEKLQIYVHKNGKEVPVLRDVHQPFTTVERALEAAQIRKAIERRGTSAWEKVQAMLPWMVPVLVLVLVLLFWEDIAKPVQAISADNQRIAEQNAIVSEQNARILTILYGPNANITVRQVVPPNAAGAGG